ncbi:MAG: DedA family protein [Gammaproteobacteria bacterium]|nr:DedA family protein [Gammaproteobacteria bacterium]
MSLEELVSSYGYMAVGVGTFLEGETILILGGFTAHRGYLELPWVIVSAFMGTLFGDQLYYYLGRIKGKSLLQKRPTWEARSTKVLDLLHKHQILLILGFRFLYGLRTVTPFLIGMSKVSPIRFLLLNMLGAAMWAIVIGTLGYLFGYTLELVIKDIKKYELIVFAIIATAGFLTWFIYFRKKL